jgi:hypothetical protein
MMEQGNSRSRNPNICASCSSLVDGITDSDLASYREANLAKECSNVSRKTVGNPLAQ